MAYGLDTDSFLNAFYRMASRRGVPEEMFSDNDTNFKGADAELKSLARELDENKINQSIANKGVTGHFNPPLAPHFGGVHETMIKSAKKAIQAILGKADINDEELTTAMVGAEGLINSRPLTYQSANPADDVPLTPNHFLHGQVGVNLHQPPMMRQTSIRERDGAVSKNSCATFGADGCVNGYRGSTHDRNGSRRNVTSRSVTSCWSSHRTHREGNGRSDGYSRSIQDKTGTCGL